MQASFAFLILATASIANAQPVDCSARREQTVLVQLDNGYVSNQMVTLAESVAQLILSPARIRLKWSNTSSFAPKVRECAAQTLAIQLDAESPSGSRPGILGYAQPFAPSGTRIHIFWDRIVTGYKQGERCYVLGHVMAHEITHVLQGVELHSDTGLMKARWNVWDVGEMTHRYLSLTDDDIDLIHKGLAPPTTRRK